MKTTKIKIQIKSTFGKILFEYECDNNTIRKTAYEAVNRGTDLRGADLRGTDLRGADLRHTNLRGADLRGANLRGADLRHTNLRGTDLRGANLRGADLRHTNLRGTDLRGANLRGTDLRHTNLRGTDLRGAKNVPMFCRWNFGITDNKINIGCKEKTIKEWDLFFNSNDVIETKRDTQEFKQIEAVYNGLKAYYQTLNK